MDKFINISLTRPDKMLTGSTEEIYRNCVKYDDAVTFSFPDLIINFQILP